MQGIGALTIDNFGTMAGVAMTGAKRWADSTKCVQCGQCTLVCPTGALSEKDETDRVLNMIDDPETVTIVQMAPAVRVTLGEEFGLPPGENVEELIVYGLKHIGVDYVMDTNFAADVVIMEEGTELLQRLKAKKANKDVALPMFTSCCPGWINYVEKHAPMIMEYLSTTRSPQAVFGALAKALLPQRLNIPREKLRVISIMPCTAKKGEAQRPTLAREEGLDVDAVLTVRELAKLLRRCGMHLKNCKPMKHDQNLFTEYSGAGAIFGTTGGVMEAAVRTCCEPMFDRPLKDFSFGLVLMRLFQTSRRFNIEIQPQLFLLQKTMLNIEGLGRQLDPDLDLWKTAKPFLEHWMDEQVGMKGLIERFRIESTHYSRIFPQLPRLVQEALEAIARPDDSLKRLERLQNGQDEINRRISRFMYFAGGVLCVYADPRMLIVVHCAAAMIIAAVLVVHPTVKEFFLQETEKRARSAAAEKG